MAAHPITTQRGMFDDPPPAEDFALAAPDADPAIDKAKHHGATFEQRGAEWFAILRKRGRVQPLAVFAAPTQAEAARLFCAYTHTKV